MSITQQLLYSTVAYLDEGNDGVKQINGRINKYLPNRINLPHNQLLYKGFQVIGYQEIGIRRNGIIFKWKFWVYLTKMEIR